MSQPSRRIQLYWLLLLLPTLAVGAGAIQLLRREQTRLREQAAQVDAARIAAVDARARLVAENVELLVGDVETGLLDALAEPPAAGLDAFLDQWERSNPLVRATFRCTSDGRILRPLAATGSDEARGFHRRFAAFFQESPPWSERGQREAKEKAAETQQDYESAAGEIRQMVASNVAKVQSARRDVQELTKSGGYAASVPAAMEKDEAMKKLDRPVAPARRGWTAWTADGRLHLLGWLQPAGGGEVRGVELELTALVSRLGGTLPAAVAAGEGYVLRDDKGRGLHQAGLVGRAAQPVARVPLAADLLPGWEVAAFVEGAESGGAGVGGGFFSSARSSWESLWPPSSREDRFCSARRNAAKRRPARRLHLSPTCRTNSRRRSPPSGSMPNCWNRGACPTARNGANTCARSGGRPSAWPGW